METYYSGKKAVEELGMPQTPVWEAVREALEWFGEPFAWQQKMT